MYLLILILLLTSNRQRQQQRQQYQIIRSVGKSINRPVLCTYTYFSSMTVILFLVSITESTTFSFICYFYNHSKLNYFSYYSQLSIINLFWRRRRRRIVRSPTNHWAKKGGKGRRRQGKGQGARQGAPKSPQH